MIDQYPTPLWLAEALVERHLSYLGKDDLVCEPSCHEGRFLRALPDYVPAFGVELDPVAADQARLMTGRRIIVGDFLTIPIEDEPSAVIGNPPFSLMVKFLQRAHKILRPHGRVGFILPAYAFQSSKTVTRYSDDWSMQVELIPRDAFSKDMEAGLTFAMFMKDKRRTMVGLALYRETMDVRGTHKAFHELIRCGRPYRSAWRAVVEAALEHFGGEASLEEIYRMVGGARPTENPFWKEKVRQIAQLHCVRTDAGRYRKAA